jgi:hypothetical protein
MSRAQHTCIKTHTQAFVNPLSGLASSSSFLRAPARGGPQQQQPQQPPQPEQPSSRILPPGGRPLHSTMSPTDASAAAASGADGGDGWDFVGAPWPDEIDYEDLEDKGAAALKVRSGDGLVGWGLFGVQRLARVTEWPAGWLADWTDGSTGPMWWWWWWWWYLVHGR